MSNDTKTPAKSPAALIDAVLGAATTSGRKYLTTRLSIALTRYRAAGSPRAADLEEEISRLNQDVDRPMVSERIGWINPEYHKKTVARLEADNAALRKALRTLVAFLAEEALAATGKGETP